MHSLIQTVLPASGVEHVAVLYSHGRRLLIVARTNYLRVFSLSSHSSSTTNDASEDDHPSSTTHNGKLVLIRRHRVHGYITGMSTVQLSSLSSTSASSSTQATNQLLISFKDSKLALLEWDDSIDDFTTLSIHTYERALVNTPIDMTSSHVSLLRVDDLSRCAVLLLPHDQLAILPFVQHELDMDMLLPSTHAITPSLPGSTSPTSPILGPSSGINGTRNEIPYLPSFILSLPTSVDSLLQHISDLVFLPGFTNPTLAVLCQPQQTWPGRLKEYKDTYKLVLFTLDLVTHRYPVISPVHGLPSDCIYLVACPSSIGGVIVISANAVIYVDQTGRKVVCPVNGWLSRISDIGSNSSTCNPPGEMDVRLEGSRAAFVDDRTLYVVLTGGEVYQVKLVVEGKSVIRLDLKEDRIAETTVPSVLATCGDNRSSGGLVFVGSTVGPSVLLKREEKVEQYEEEVQADVDMGDQEGAKKDEQLEQQQQQQVDVEMDSDDDDIYGPSARTLTSIPTNTTSSGTITSSAQQTNQNRIQTRITTELSLVDYIPDYGNISSMSFSLTTNSFHPSEDPSSFASSSATVAGGATGAGGVGGTSSEKYIPELLCATGSGRLGGFTLFQRDLPCRLKRRLHAIGGARGIWSFAVRSGGSHKDKDKDGAWDNVVVSTDATPSPGLSRIASRSSKSDLVIDNRIPGTTIGAGPFFGGSAMLHVMSGSIRVLEPDGSERQVIKDVDTSGLARARIRSTSILDPYVLIFREDDSIGLFVETERGRIRRKDMSPMGDKTSRYIAGTFFEDTDGTFELIGVPSGDGGATGSNKWLLLVRPQGIVEIWALPKLTLVFSTPSLATLDALIVDSRDEAAKSLPPPEGGLRKPQPNDIDQILVAPLGERDANNHLFVYLRNGQLAVYSILPWKSVDDAHAVPRNVGLGVRFIKILSKTFDSTLPPATSTTSINGQQTSPEDITMSPTTTTGTPSLEQQQQKPLINQMFEQPKPTSILEQKKAYRQLIPFSTRERKGVFFTGDVPSWVLKSDKGGVNVYPAGYGVVHSFSSTTLWENDREFLIYSDEGPALIEWIPHFNLDHPLPCRSIRCERPYSHVLFDPSTCLLVAASSLRSRFASFDEDDQKVWSVDAPNISDPTVECSTLELINSDPWVVLDGYEFATNEFVNALERVTLETAGSENGQKEFIAVGTSIVRGEDLAVKGATYIFEISEVVPDRNVQPRRWYKLRLRYRDDAKGPVTALSGFNGYLVSSMGQKIFVRAFDSDERLVGIAFLDVGIYVTSLRTLKNLLLIGDAVKSVWFVAFQEDPYKLVILAKDVQRHCITSVDFFFAGDQLAILAGDESGVMRVYAYDPTDPDSRNGQLLSLRTEFNAQVEYRTSTLVARRTKFEHDVPQARLLLGHTDGSLTSLTSVDDRSAKRLQLLQGQLTRNVQHVAGLNPRAHRTVKNEHVSKPLTKGILDGDLLEYFQALSDTRQREITRQIGMEPPTLLKDWTSLAGVW